MTIHIERHPCVADSDTILRWLIETDESRLQKLWEAADACRHEHVGDEVHLRGLVEISNHCVRQCCYCGIRASNRPLTRYRITQTEIMSCVHQAVRLGYGTVVIQAGEDDGLSRQHITDLVRQIKRETNLAITLSLGERPAEDLVAWRQAGADRYLLRIETSNLDLLARIHPPRPGGRSVENRIEMLRILKRLGFEVGSGSLIGIPGQSYADLVADLELFRELEVDMIGVGPYIAHPDTPLGANPESVIGAPLPPEMQAPNSELMTYKMMALARLLCPEANIPSTTALATLNLAAGRELGLQRGANVVMPNLTPVEYRALYEVYPDKACIRETAEQCHSCMGVRIVGLGRKIGQGPGTAVSMTRRQIDRSDESTSAA
jgi:biotin synthase